MVKSFIRLIYFFTVNSKKDRTRVVRAKIALPCQNIERVEISRRSHNNVLIVTHVHDGRCFVRVFETARTAVAITLHEVC